MSQNVFADLELPNPEERLVKAELVLSIRKMTASSGMNQARLAERVGLTQINMSRLFSGMTKDISVEKLLRVKTALLGDV